MKVFIEDDIEAGTYLRKEKCWSFSSYEIEVSEEFFEEVERIRREHEEIQNILSKMWREASREAKLTSTKNGVQSKGFN